MILGFVSDAHGNPDGLAGCLRFLRGAGARRIYFLGDAVGYFPEANRVLDLLRDAGATCIRGNHEAMLLGQLPIPEERARIYRLDAARATLEARHREWIEHWPDRCEVHVPEGRLLLVHGSPASPLTGYVYPDSDLTPFAHLPVAAVVMGHTHRPFMARSGAVAVTNAGSSGMPRDAGHLASCATYDEVSRQFRIHRIPFDAAGLVGRWRDRIDAAAAACLLRAPEAPLVGEVVAG